MLRLVQIFAFTLTVLLLSACHTAQRYVETGNYDGAIDYVVSHISGKKNKKTEYVQALELAFQKAQDRDIRLVDNLVAENRPENWEKVNAIHRRVQQRQNKIAPLLPLQAKDGYRASFSFVNIEKLERQSREKAADFLYEKAQRQLADANSGNRMAARNAYETLLDLENRYYKNYRSTDEMKRQAMELGTTHILFEVGNQSNQVLPRDFFDRILAIGTRDLNSKWQAYHFNKSAGVEMDYTVKFNVRRIDISPERVQERVYTDCTEIQDGWDYELDMKGNVKKDSLGNDIKKERFINIYADVLEVFQTKAVRLTGSVDIFDARNGNRIDSRELSTEILFENYASTFKGDQRALSDLTRQRLGNRPLPFPMTEDMLVQAADKLKPNLREELRRNRVIL
ncbi:MAG: hypothetical protein IPL65_01715 [Lewinellaceae bacterium]|nr:hypothetical protein [Lewinellaceae bacterium]